MKIKFLHTLNLKNNMASPTPITVIELRNYLLKPGFTNKFNAYFSDHFIQPMLGMGVAILGKFKIKNNNNRFVWIRGFESMQQRKKFLPDFYTTSEVWKKYKKGANEMIRNSDNVYLLRPLQSGHTLDDINAGIESNIFKSEATFAAVDLYIANTRLKEFISFYNNHYLVILRSLGIETTLWVSEMGENDFPQLPVFQNKDLLATITFYKNENEYNILSKKIKLEIKKHSNLRVMMQDIITTHEEILLHKI
ncbi:MAG: hypothetical protein WAU24_07285 [Chitinophagaceae bacterium]